MMTHEEYELTGNSHTSPETGQVSVHANQDSRENASGKNNNEKIARHLNSRSDTPNIYLSASDSSSGEDVLQVTMLDKSLEELPAQVKEIPDAADTIPDGGYGWLIVVSCFLINFNTWGANSGFAIYLNYYLNHDTFAGGDKYDYALIGGITFGLGLFCAPLIIMLQGKIGVHTTVIMGNCFQFAALMMASFSKKLWQLYLTQGVLQAFGLAFVSLSIYSILAQWFKKKRGLASSVSAAGSGCGGLLYNLGMQKVLESRSVFWALRVQSIICFSLLWVSIALLRTRVKVKYSMFDMRIAKSAGFYMVIFFYVFCMFGYVVVLYDMASVTTSMGYSAYQGSISSAMVQVGSVVGRPIVGVFSDRYGAVAVTSVVYLICGILTLAMWIPANNYATILAYCVMMGGMMGLVFGATPPILGMLFGLHRINVGLGMSWIFLALAAMASPVISLALKEGNGNTVSAGQYNHSALFSGIAFLAASATLLIMRGYLLVRHDMMKDKDDDHDHLLVWVPFSAPLKNCLRKANHI